MTIAKGTLVRQVVQVIEGTVERFEVDQETGEIQYLVVWTDEAGIINCKYFKEGEIAPVV